jgi:hypothetical protein
MIGVKVGDTAGASEAVCLLWCSFGLYLSPLLASTTCVRITEGKSRLFGWLGGHLKKIMDILY